MISSSDSEDEDEKSPNIVSDNMVTVVQEIVEPLSKLKVEDIHGKGITIFTVKSCQISENRSLPVSFSTPH